MRRVLHIPSSFLSRVSFAVLILNSFSISGETQTTSTEPLNVPLEITNPYTISLHVDWVVLPVTVSDRHGGLISNLERTHFTIYEDGRPQDIRLFKHEEIPLTLGLVIDNSGSMRGKRAYVIAAALSLVGSLSSEDQVFIVNFNDTAELGLQSDRGFTNNLDQVKLALTTGFSAGRTALHDAVGLALEQLGKGHHEKKAILLISDGGDNASHLKLDQVLWQAKQSRAVIYTISLLDSESREQNPRILRQLARISGGQFFAPSSMTELEMICQKISQDIRNQYTLGYIPTNQVRDGSFRTIQIRLNLPRPSHYSVRTREGYIAPKGEKEAPQ